MATTRPQAKAVSAGERVGANTKLKARRRAVTGRIGDAGGYDLIKFLSDDQIRSHLLDAIPVLTHLGGCTKRGACGPDP